REILNLQVIKIRRDAHTRIAEGWQPWEGNLRTPVVFVVGAILQQEAHVFPGPTGESIVVIKRPHLAVERRLRQGQPEEDRHAGGAGGVLRASCRPSWQKRS